MKKVMITGSLGQIGSELVLRLRKDLGKDNVVATDIRRLDGHFVCEEGTFEILDVMNYEDMLKIAHDHKVDTLVHLAALLSAVGETKPQFAWHLNMGGLMNALEVSRELNLKFFTPSSIACFGPSTPANDTPQDTIQRPTTMYGITKTAGELLCDYYFSKFGVDTRGLRFPGLISYTTAPGGGTTDYAVDIYYKAIEQGKYDCYIAKGTFMDMMYMPDAIEAIVKLMNADPKRLIHRNAFNISAMSFDPEGIKASIQKYIPDFTMDYKVDPIRQGIADSWPNSLDCSAAKSEWDFDPLYNLDKMTQDMIENLKGKLKK